MGALNGNGRCLRLHVVSRSLPKECSKDKRQHQDPGSETEPGAPGIPFLSCDLLFPQAPRPPEVEQKVRIRDIENLFLFVPVDCTILRELFESELRHVQTRPGDAGTDR